jgi:hypothetical protein
MKKSGLSAFIIILSLSLPTWGAPDLSDYRRQIRLEVTRKSPTYQRVFNICSRPYDLSKTVYAQAAALEVGRMATFDMDMWEEKLIQEFKISTLLEQDLKHEGFNLALSDCGFSERESQYFVMNLLALDAMGKLGGLGVSAWIYVKIVWKYGKILYAKFPKTSIATSLGFAALAVKENLWRFQGAPPPEAKHQPNSVDASELASSLIAQADPSRSKQMRAQLIELRIQEIESEMMGLDPAQPEFKALDKEKSDLMALAEL